MRAHSSQHQPPMRNCIVFLLFAFACLGQHALGVSSLRRFAPAASISSSSGVDEEDLDWDDEFDPELEKRHEFLFEDDSDEGYNNSDSGEGLDEMHPLRTAEWRILSRPLLSLQSREECIIFHSNSTLTTDNGAHGEWKLDVGGVSWDILDSEKDALRHYRAELHWNVFGEQPRMYRGTICRDRTKESFLPPWLFRPVIGTFKGRGCGSDTLDQSYRHRDQPNIPRENRFDSY
jgi:hypothetical protein